MSSNKNLFMEYLKDRTCKNYSNHTTIWTYQTSSVPLDVYLGYVKNIEDIIIKEMPAIFPYYTE